MKYEMTIAGKKRALPLCPLNDELYIAAFVIFGDTELTCACAAELLRLAPEFDYIMTAESKGIPLAHEMARQSGDRRYFVARKKPKLYMTGTFEVTVNSITTEGEQKLYLDSADAELLRGKRVLAVDDVISTGESLDALLTLLDEAGADVVAKMCILAEGDAAKRDDITYLEPLPLFDAKGNPLK